MYKYVRGSGSSLPSEIKRYADLAIRSYNETLPIGYGVVDIVRATKFLCDGFYFRITFTAKLPDQDDANALTFRARITNGITRTKVDSVRVVTAPATSPMIDAPAI